MMIVRNLNSLDKMRFSARFRSHTTQTIEVYIANQEMENFLRNHNGGIGIERNVNLAFDILNCRSV
jgi:hypothetical protein